MRLKVGLTLCLIVLAASLVDAGKRNGHKRKRKLRQKQLRGKSGCKYFRKGQMSECDESKGTRSVTFHLKKGVNCPFTQVFHQPCDQGDGAANNSVDSGCSYSRQTAHWTECGPGIMSKKMVMQLKSGQSSSCPQTRTATAPCKRRKNKVGKLKKKKGKRKGKACKYHKEPWSECDVNTTTRTRQLTLRKGDLNVCLPKKTITKKCKKPCKYTKGPWLPCNEVTNEKMRELILKKGDPNVCNATSTIVKPCRRRNAFTAAKTSQCKYKPLAWGECDLRTNTMTRVLKLRSGDPALCQQAKQLTRKCRKPCKFSKGEWSECDESTGLKTRTDSLVKGEHAKCESTRVITRKCGMDGDCKYEVSEWGVCDEATKERTRIKKLVSGDPEKCQAEVKISRHCLKLNGEESCFLGNWGEYGPCQNGVMMKHRPVIAGGVQCERKAVKAKPC